MAEAQVLPTAAVFPGQGSQQVGMGWDLHQAFPQVAQLYAHADALLGIPLSQCCFEGPEEELTRTINAQPALLTTSVAVLLALGGRLDRGGRMQLPPSLPPLRFAAGHSLGEYTALVAAGALSFPDALHLVRERGRLMDQAHDGSMAAVLGLEESELEGIVEQAQQMFGQDVALVIANYNCPGQLVLSGASKALAWAMGAAQERGARRVIPIKVSAAFHSPLMEKAAVGLAQAVSQIEFDHARIPVIANASAGPIRQPEALRSELITQVCAPVRWTNSLHYAWRQGVRRFLEIGPGKVLAGLIRRTLPEAVVENVGTLEQVQALQGE